LAGAAICGIIRFYSPAQEDRTGMSETFDVGKLIADQLASCSVKLVASLPDNWLMEVIEGINHDGRFIHVPVNREESALGLCSGAYMGALGSCALMGASGLMTVIYV
jgi:sulfopyruvate decarboxylase TPP-binding subunit